MLYFLVAVFLEVSMYHFIVNPRASRGHGEKVWRKLERYLQHTRVEYEVLMTRTPGDAKLFARRLNKLNQGPHTIIAVGGCGTVNEVLDGLSIDAPVTLGFIPTDAGNDLAKGLRLPRNPVRCLQRILNPEHPMWLDYGVLSYEKEEPRYRRFIVSSGIGLDAAVSYRLLEIQNKSGFRPWIPKRLAYLLLGIQILLHWVPPKGYLILDGTRKIEFNHIYFISIHVHPYEGGGFLFAPMADGADGMLEMCVVHNSTKQGVLISGINAFLGKGGYRRGVRYYSCREAWIHVDAPMMVHVDGENAYSQTDIHVRCIEKKVRMIV